ncbi:DUF2183 domain-containing protein [Segetibacter sp. 3557_3]|uniref:App1 family protein n=1 Tax=Segetibacter sp. 3557_3 TaxID=2547429 RepID=UPI0010586DDA|nr:phosphatase domain-containing protein [Segetibacter sp. 3557_3]TDH20043.1 DUF2183 domain-containing protein [Segetibacter sp. 3557_3]
MNSSTNTPNVPDRPFVKRIKKKLLHWVRLTNDPVVKVYQGYGFGSRLVVFGHVFTLSPLPRKKYRKNLWTNTLALLRSFMVRPVRDASVRLRWKDKCVQVSTAADGFFRFELDIEQQLPPGKHQVEVEWVHDSPNSHVVKGAGKGSVLISPPNKFTCISDIDDTFLISHSSNLRKRLYVLFTKNAHSRKPFEGVVSHYRLLAKSGSRDTNMPNPFFFVSSSEWNLHDFITEFSNKNSLPQGVYLLNQVKRLRQLLNTGQNNHSTKFTRIVRIIEAFPNQSYVLLGDDSQQDPYIYAAIVEHFPGRIKSVYLRHVYDKNVDKVKEVVKKIEAKGIPCCHFTSSAEAIEHSFNIGLLTLQ